MVLDKSDLPWLFEFLTLVAVIVGLSFGAVELRQLRSAQEAQTVLLLAETIRSDEYVDALSLISSLPDGLTADEMRDVLGADGIRAFTQLTLTYESLGVMVFRGDVSIQWVDELFRRGVLLTWSKMKPLIKDIRESSGYDGYYEWHQWLAEQLGESIADQPVPAYEAHKDWTP